MKKILLLFMVFNTCLLSASMIHESIKYLENPEAKAAVKATSRPMLRKEWSEYVHEYWNHLTTGSGQFIDLITPETQQHGLKQLGLLPQDIHMIESWIKEFQIRDQNFIEFAKPQLPEWLAREYENLTYQVAVDWEQWIVSNLGDRNIRLGLVAHMLQVTNKRYVYVKKSIMHNPQFSDILQQNRDKIKQDLRFASYKYDHIANITNNQISQGAEYIIFPVQNDKRQEFLDILKVILDPVAGDPTLTVVIIFPDRNIEIGQTFRTPPFIKNLVIIGRDITSIGDNFLSECSWLENLNLSLLSNARDIGNFFLYQCSGLKRLDLSGLSHVKVIRNAFLHRCSGLKDLDLAPLSSVEKIGDFFLGKCGGLQRLDLRGLSNVQDIGDYFLYQSSGLKDLDFAWLSRVEKIGKSFLDECSGLQRLNLSGLSNVKDIGDNFLKGCSGLKELDLSPLSRVEKIRISFLAKCSGLERLNLSGLSNVQDIGDYFLNACSGLKELNLASLSRVEKIGDAFLYGCSGLKRLDLAQLSSVKDIGRAFLYECSGLEKLDLSSLSKMEKIEDYFLVGCSGLQRLDLIGLSKVKSIGEYFLGRCSGLQELDLTPLSSVESIGAYFLEGWSSSLPITMTEKVLSVIKINNEELIKIDVPSEAASAA